MHFTTLVKTGFNTRLGYDSQDNIQEDDIITQVIPTIDGCADRCFGTPGCHRFMFHTSDQCEIIFSSDRTRDYIYPATDHYINLANTVPGRDLKQFPLLLALTVSQI